MFLLREKDDIKIFILYLLANIDRPVDFPTLNDIVVQDDFVGQFDFMEGFYELQDTDAIEKTAVDGADYFSISEKGRAAVEMLQSDLLKTVREKALRSAKRMLSFRADGAKTESHITTLSVDKHRLECIWRNHDGIYMQTNVVVSTRREAELLKYHFDDRAEFVYKGIMSLLSGDMNYLADSWADEDTSAADGKD